MPRDVDGSIHPRMDQDGPKELAERSEASYDKFVHIVRAYYYDLFVHIFKKVVMTNLFIFHEKLISHNTQISDARSSRCQFI